MISGYLVDHVLEVYVLEDARPVDGVQVRVHEVKHHVQVFIVVRFYYVVLK
jgi:hypothetical protein